MPKAILVDMKGKKLGEAQLPDSIFGLQPNQAVVHELVRNHLANRRSGTQSTLTRAEVRGGGRKPWRQKGTGRARQGSTRSPQWTHGGVALGPKPRKYHFTINKKVRRLGILSALSDKAVTNNVIVVRGLGMESPKTRDFASFLSAAGATGRSLVVTADVNKNVVLSARNIPGVITTPSNILSVYDIVVSGKLIIDEAAISKIEEVYAQ